MHHPWTYHSWKRTMSLPELTPDKDIKLQENDVFCKNILQHTGCSKYEDYFQDAMAILHKKIIDFSSVFSAVVVPQILMKYSLCASHDSLGHFGAKKLYYFLNSLYFFKGMRRKLHECMGSYHKCQIRNHQKPRFIDPHQDIAETPQDHLSINLMGPYKTTWQGNIYVLTAVCNLTGYLMTTPHQPQSNENLESSHRFIKDCLKILYRWCSWMGSITHICNSCI